MGLREETTADIKNAFDTDLADAVRKVRHRMISISDYDPDNKTPDKVITTNESRGVFDNFSKSEISSGSGGIGRYTADLGSVKFLPTDVVLTVLQLEFINVPNPDDEIIDIAENKTYKVIAYEEDPAKVIWEIILRTESDSG